MNPQQLNLTPVVKNLLILNILFYVGTKFVFPDLYGLLMAYFPTSPDFKPFQILTHMFMHDHKGLFHIFFNMMGLVMFGPRIEMVWGPQRFLIYYLLCGLGAMVCQWGLYYYQYQSGTMSIEALDMVRMLGASGCLFGLLAAYAYLYPEDRVGIMFLPILMPAKYAVPVFAALELFLGLGNFQTGIAHFAHLGGALTGLIVILFWFKSLR
jgi:membrane associated rhomboid family serine protease